MDASVVGLYTRWPRRHLYTRWPRRRGAEASLTPETDAATGTRTAAADTRVADVSSALGSRRAAEAAGKSNRQLRAAF